MVSSPFSHDYNQDGDETTMKAQSLCRLVNLSICLGVIGSACAIAFQRWPTHAWQTRTYDGFSMEECFLFGAVLTGVTVSTAIGVRRLLLRGPFDRPMLTGAMMEVTTPTVFYAAVLLGLLRPSYFSQGLLLSLTANAQILHHVSCGGRYSRPHIAECILALSVFAFQLPVLLAPGSMDSNLLGVDHTSGALVRLHLTPAQAISYYFSQGIEAYSVRRVWPSGALGSVLWLWHWVGVRAFILLVQVRRIVRLRLRSRITCFAHN